jgi:sugar O-acyltransferase (sialic acid O-acetyltransferase NeuD family)
VNVVVLGAGQFAREMTGICADLDKSVWAYAVDVSPERDTLLGRPVVYFASLEPGVPLVCGMAVRGRWRLLEKAFGLGVVTLALVHPSASVDASVHVGSLSVVNRGVAVGWGAVVKRGVLVNRGATVGHDCFLDDYCTVGPGANLAGGVVVREKAFVGMGANVREGLTIGEGATVGMGAVVLEDVPDGETWWGNPARRAR